MAGKIKKTSKKGPRLDINRLFLPTKPVYPDDESFFSGRVELFNQCTKALLMEDVVLLLYGQEGVGKTSFSWQLMKVLDSDETEYLPFRVECSERINRVDKLIIEMLKPSRATYSLYSVFPELYDDNQFIKFIERAYKIDMWSIGTDYEKDGSDSLLVDNLQKILKEVITFIKENSKKPVIFIDDIDKFDGKETLLQFVQDIEGVRFVLAENVENHVPIIKHNIIKKRNVIIEEIEVEPLYEDDIKDIYDRAVYKAKEVYKINIKFDEDFIRKVTIISNGYPWLAQRIGYYSVEFGLAYSRDNAILVDNRYLNDVMDKIIHKELHDVSDMWFELSTLTESIKELYDILSVEKRGLDMGEIRIRGKDSSFKRWLGAKLGFAVMEGFVRKDSRERYWIQNPLMRALFIKYYSKLKTPEDSSTKKVLKKQKNVG